MLESHHYPEQRVAGAKLRAKERVLAYLQRELSRQDLPAGARLPTSRALAKELGVSVSTVQTVFQSLAKAGVISTVVGNGSFLLNPPNRNTSLFRIGVAFDFLAESGARDTWQAAISAAILEHAGRLSGHISVAPIVLGNQTLEQSINTLESWRDRVDGIILKASPELAAYCATSRLKNIPVVHLNPPWPSATSNFVSADYLAGFQRVSQAFVRSGRRHILYLDNFAEEFSPAGSLRNAGLVAGIGHRIGREVRYTVLRPGGSAEENGYRAMAEVFSAGRDLPDAIVCTGNLLAIGVKRYLTENHIRVPEDVSIIGGTGSERAIALVAGLTQIQQPLDQIGVELVEMLRRVKAEGRSQAAVFFPITFGIGKSTTPAENEWLGVDQASDAVFPPSPGFHAGSVSG